MTLKMVKDSYTILGVMSGTSLDGIDLAYVDFRKTDTWNFEIKFAETIPYSKTWKNRLRQAIHYGPSALSEFNIKYTEFLASVIKEFITKNNIKNLDAVCSHGHTILHQPEKGLTLQIGNLPQIAKLIGHLVVCDFRSQDVALGGQGAPLVPIGDKLLFGDYDYCLNLGGFANISFEKDNNRIAYDVCPVNIVLNALSEKLGHDYDAFGKLSQQGVLNDELLNALNRLSYYGQKPPKSLGLEWVQKEVFSLINSYGLKTEDSLRTFTEHVAMQLALQFEKNKAVLITGGGAYNTFLIERLKKQTQAKIVIPDKNTIEYKEALIFGLLGILKLRNEVNCLASVTGAIKNHSAGKVFYP